MDKNKNLQNIIRQVVLDAPVTEEFARKLGKSSSTLMREINPHTKNAKLGVETLLEIMKITNDIRPLEQIVKQFNMRITLKNI